MNILFILQRYPGFGGIETVTRLLSEELCKQPGGNVSIFSTSYQDNAAQRLPLSNWELVISDKNKMEQIRDLDKLFCRKKIDVVIYQDSYVPEEYLLEHLAKYPVKIIVCEHNTPNALLIGYRNAYREVKLSSFLRLLQKGRRLVRFYQERHKAKMHHRKMFQLADKYVLLSNHFRKILKREYQIDANDNKIVSIGNPVSLPIGHIQDKQKEALFVGRLTGQKGTNYLVRIWCQIAHRHRDWTLTVVGDGEEKASMMKAFDEAGVHNVAFEGFHTDVLNYYKRASCLLLTSLYEGWPMVLFEAMSQGCIPFAFSSYDSVYDIIDHERNGYLVKAFDVEAYVRTLEMFMMAPEDLQNRFRQEALEKASKFTTAAIVQKWINLINSII